MSMGNSHGLTRRNLVQASIDTKRSGGDSDGNPYGDACSYFKEGGRFTAHSKEE